MKTSITHIDQTTGQLRYTAKDGAPEEHVQPISVYKAAEDIKYGHAVAIATLDELRLIDQKINKGFALDPDSYIVRADSSKHQQVLGIATATVKVGEMVHVQQWGKFTYTWEAYYNGPSSARYRKGERAKPTGGAHQPVYNPPFTFNDVGKPVYVLFDGPSFNPTVANDDGEIERTVERRGELTVDRNEALRTHKGILQVGFVADAPNLGTDNTDVQSDKRVIIEIAPNTDARGPIDNTQFEAILGEDITIPKNDCLRAFAFGKTYEKTFSGHISITKVGNGNLPGFIGLMRPDGYTVILCNSYNEFNISSGKPTQILEDIDDDFWRKVQLTGIKPEIRINFNPNNFGSVFVGALVQLGFINPTVSQETNGLKITFNTNEYGPINLYTSKYWGNSNGWKCDIKVNTGSDGTKGYVVPADCTTADLANVCGLYYGGQYDVNLKKGESILLIRTGEFKITSETYTARGPGGLLTDSGTFYLGKNGKLIDGVPGYATQVVKLADAKTNDTLVVDIADIRYPIMDQLPVGYVKRSVDNKPEFGYLLMDGTTEIENANQKYDKLISRLLEQFKKDDVVKATNPDQTIAKFIIPKVTYPGPTADGILAQVKYLENGVFYDTPRVPSIYHVGTLIGDTEHAYTKDIDITTIIQSGVKDSYRRELDEASLDIHLFVAKNNNSSYTEVQPGDHLYNGIVHYGYRWKIIRDNDRYFLKMDTMEGLGVVITEGKSVAPYPAIGYSYKCIITHREWFQRQYDVKELFDSWKTQTNVVEDVITKVMTNDLMTVGLTVKDNGKVANVNFGDSANNSVKLNAYIGATSIININEQGLTFQSGPYTTDTNQRKVTFRNGGFRVSGSISRALYPDPTELIPLQILQEHENDSANDKQVHGLENGARGNINARQLADLPLGRRHSKFTKEQIIEQGAWIPYSNTLGTTGIGRGLVFSQEDLDITTVTVTNASTSFDLTSDMGVKYQAFFGSKRETIAIGERHDYSQNATNDISFVKRTGDVETDASVKVGKLSAGHTSVQTLTMTSSIDWKTVNAVEENIYTDVIANFPPPSGKPGFDVKLNKIEEKFDSALQAIYELPLAYFKYNDDPESFKKYLGIITERVNQVATALTLPNPEKLPNRSIFNTDDFQGVTFDDNNPKAGSYLYRYTADQLKSIISYLSLFIDNNGKAQNVLSTLGVLLKGAKETQERLLKLEASAFGMDAKTIPGDKLKHTIQDQVTGLTQEPPYIGLNRLVKALAAEVFLDYDPTSVTSDSVISKNPNFSRLDKLEKDVRGKNAADDQENSKSEVNDIFLIAEKQTGTTDAADNVKVNTTTKTHSYGIEHVYPSENPVANKDYHSGGSTYPKYISGNGQNDEAKKPTVTPTDLGKTALSFDGINDAINRITNKLNALTRSVNGQDDICATPHRLNVLRNNVKILLDNVYGEPARNYKDKDGLKSESFRSWMISQTGKDEIVSMNDIMTKDIFEYLLGKKSDTQSDRKTVETFKKIAVDKMEPFSKKISADVISYTENNKVTEGFVGKKPLTINDANERATIFDFLTDVIGRDWVIRPKVDDVAPTDRKLATWQEWSDLKRKSFTISDRLANVERVLDLVAFAFLKNSTGDLRDNLDATYSNVTLDLNVNKVVNKELLKSAYTETEIKGFINYHDLIGYGNQKSLDGVSASSLYDLTINLLGWIGTTYDNGWKYIRQRPQDYDLPWSNENIEPDYYKDKGISLKNWGDHAKRATARIADNTLSESHAKEGLFTYSVIQNLYRRLKETEKELTVIKESVLGWDTDKGKSYYEVDSYLYDQKIIVDSTDKYLRHSLAKDVTNLMKTVFGKVDMSGNSVISYKYRDVIAGDGDDVFDNGDNLISKIVSDLYTTPIAFTWEGPGKTPVQIKGKGTPFPIIDLNRETKDIYYDFRDGYDIPSSLLSMGYRKAIFSGNVGSISHVIKRFSSNIYNLIGMPKYDNQVNNAVIFGEMSNKILFNYILKSQIPVYDKQEMVGTSYSYFGKGAFNVEEEKQTSILNLLSEIVPIYASLGHIQKTSTVLKVNAFPTSVFDYEKNNPQIPIGYCVFAPVTEQAGDSSKAIYVYTGIDNPKITVDKKPIKWARIQETIDVWYKGNFLNWVYTNPTKRNQIAVDDFGKFIVFLDEARTYEELVDVDLVCKIYQFDIKYAPIVKQNETIINWDIIDRTGKLKTVAVPKNVYLPLGQTGETPDPTALNNIRWGKFESWLSSQGISTGPVTALKTAVSNISDVLNSANSTAFNIFITAAQANRSSVVSALMIISSLNSFTNLPSDKIPSWKTEVVNGSSIEYKNHNFENASWYSSKDLESSLNTFNSIGTGILAEEFENNEPKWADPRLRHVKIETVNVDYGPWNPWNSELVMDGLGSTSKIYRPRFSGPGGMEDDPGLKKSLWNLGLTTYEFVKYLAMEVRQVEGEMVARLSDLNRRMTPWNDVSDIRGSFNNHVWGKEAIYDYTAYGEINRGSFLELQSSMSSIPSVAERVNIGLEKRVLELERYIWREVACYTPNWAELDTSNSKPTQIGYYTGLDGNIAGTPNSDTHHSIFNIASTTAKNLNTRVTELEERVVYQDFAENFDSKIVADIVTSIVDKHNIRVKQSRVDVTNDWDASTSNQKANQITVTTDYKSSHFEFALATGTLETDSVTGGKKRTDVITLNRNIEVPIKVEKSSKSAEMTHEKIELKDSNKTSVLLSTALTLTDDTHKSEFKAGSLDIDNLLKIDSTGAQLTVNLTGSNKTSQFQEHKDVDTITSVTSNATGAIVIKGEQLILGCNVTPHHMAKDVRWEAVSGGNVFGNVFTATAVGTAKVKAVFDNAIGTKEFSFDITVIKPLIIKLGLTVIIPEIIKNGVTLHAIIQNGILSGVKYEWYRVLVSNVNNLVKVADTSTYTPESFIDETTTPDYYYYVRISHDDYDGTIESNWVTRQRLGITGV